MGIKTIPLYVHSNSVSYDTRNGSRYEITVLSSMEDCIGKTGYGSIVDYNGIAVLDAFVEDTTLKRW